MNEWQKIDTAPIDGRPILVYSTLGPTVAYWNTNLYYPTWNLLVPGNYAEDCVVDPSHWMELPSNPQIKRN